MSSLLGIFGLGQAVTSDPQLPDPSLPDEYRNYLKAHNSEYYNAMVAQAAQASYPISKSAKNIRVAQIARETLIKRVMGIHKYDRDIPDKNFLTCAFVNEKIYVFFVINDKEGILSENVGMFPSDRLITQLRLVLDTDP